ncbi:hypothetical protein FOZ62_021944, partial [Perkinsus olseni]
PKATYGGASIASTLQHIRVGWHSGFCAHTKDVKKAFYKFVTIRMIFGLAVGPAGLEHSMNVIRSLARLRCPENPVLRHGCEIYLDDISFFGNHDDVIEAECAFKETA